MSLTQVDPLLLTAQQIRERYGRFGAPFPQMNHHRNTLLSWEKQGILHPIRTPGRCRDAEGEGA